MSWFKFCIGIHKHVSWDQFTCYLALLVGWSVVVYKYIEDPMWTTIKRLRIHCRISPPAN
jgi:hypothetical protein